MFRTGFRNKKDKRKNKEIFVKNGAAVLEQIISLHNGVCNPIRSYSFQQLQSATGDFYWMIHEDLNYKLYKGIHEDREISVKKFFVNTHAALEGIANEVAIASRMSNHNNVLKLLGCCLETELPLLVYEFPILGNLGRQIYKPNDNQLPWELKLKIVTGIANAVAYLHCGLSKMIIHRDIKPRNIFLGENHTVKLFEFQEAIPIPEGETHVFAETVSGMPGYFAPEVLEHGRLTEKSDVYAFGVLLSEVFMGEKYHEFQDRYREICNNTSDSLRVQSFDSLGFQPDDIRWQEGENREPVSTRIQPNDDDSSGEISQEIFDIYPQEEERTPLNSSHQMEDFNARAIKYYFESYLREESSAQEIDYVKLLLSCVNFNPDERPNMIEVEKALRRIKTI